MRWGLFILGLLGLLVFGTFAGLGVVATYGALVGALEQPAKILTVVRGPFAIAAWFFLAMASTAAMIVAFDPPSKNGPPGDHT